MRNAVFHTAMSALLAVTVSKGKTLVSDEPHDHSHHVLIQQKSQQFAGKAMVPNSIICCGQIDKYDIDLSFKESSMFWVSKIT